MSDDFRTSLDAIPNSDRAALRDIVEQAEMRFYEGDWSDLSRSETFVEAPAPAALLRGMVVSPDDVTTAIDRVELRWRLDVIMALDDYLS